MKKEQVYCNNLFAYSRFVTREVNIGGVPLGGKNPIRIQSMTTTDTMDAEGTIAQCIRMIEAGCDYVRITAPSKRDAENLKPIKDGIRKQGYKTPIIADIHFTPNAAEIAARIVEKVRVNPGNYADKKKFQTLDFDDKTYNLELERIRDKFLPLVKICKEYGTAMRIGTNHGSLSDRIMSRYGDTPKGMVESALEFVRICEEENFHDIVLSMKASNPQIMVQAYRLLVNKMIDENMNYPLHLGVTEAGEGEDGRIKSAIGIGTLLEDGLGDTIRVSLTEAPEFEVPVAKDLVNRYKNRIPHKAIQPQNTDSFNPLVYDKRASIKIGNIGETNVPRIIQDFSHYEKITPANLFAVGYHYAVNDDKWHLSDMACDYIYSGNKILDFEIPGSLGVICDYPTWKENQQKERYYPLYSAQDFISENDFSPLLNFIRITTSRFDTVLLEKLKNTANVVLIIENESTHAMADLRAACFKLETEKIKIPIIFKRTFENLSESELQLYSATDLGALLIDGYGDGIFISAQHCGSMQMLNSTAFAILQASRTRISRTEYISCPSCGRTEFNLEETTAKIRAVTQHLKGVKIGIMGCIVNGPGEMADAHYGYVGTGVGKITLYKEKEIVKRNIPEADAVNELITLIKENGDWVDAPV